MTLSEIETAFAAIRAIADELLKFPDRSLAVRLEAECRRYDSDLRGRFGNIIGPLHGVGAAAALYKKARVDVTAARDKLHRALGHTEIAICIHRGCR